MLRKTRSEIMDDFKAQVAQGKILVGVGAGTGITAKCSEKADVDMLIIYNSGRFRMAGRGSLSGLLSYGDANAIVQEMGQEVDMIREAHKLDLLTCPYVFDPDQAKAMAEAGADILVAHMGLTTKGTIGAETAVTLDDCCVKIREIIKAGREVNPDIMVICHGGPIADPEDAAYVIKNVPEIDGFFGASSIERLASERGMTAQAAAFKAIEK